MNDMTIEQVSTVLNAIVEQATGQQPNIAVTDTSSFVTVAQTALKTGYDNVINAISQVLSRTIFSIRPYSKKFKGLEVSAQRWGNHVRKLQVIDNTFENDQRYDLTDGYSVDMYSVKKPKVAQTNFYGQVTYQDHLTIFRDQLDVAFSSPTEFASFITMIMQNMADRINQADEEFDRAAVANFIGGKIGTEAYLADNTLPGTGSIIHLLTEYNDYLGLEDDLEADPPVIKRYTSETFKEPTVYEPFIKWVFGRMSTIAQFMSERSVKYHTNLTDKPIMRHTPATNARMYLFSPVLNDIKSSVLSDIYNDELLKFADHESVNYWQNIDAPDTIKVKAEYMLPNGTLDNSDITQADVFGVILDEEAIGTNRCSEWSERTPFNAAGGYSNIYWHWTRRYWNDFTENGVVLLLD